MKMSLLLIFWYMVADLDLTYGDVPVVVFVFLTSCCWRCSGVFVDVDIFIYTTCTLTGMV